MSAYLHLHLSTFQMSKYNVMLRVCNERDLGYSTLTDKTPSCPRLWVSGSQYLTPEPRFRCLVLHHQGLEELELKKHPKTAVFDQIWLFLSGFLVLVLLKVDDPAPNP